MGRPTIDPWYRSGERFPSIPASLQPPPADWEWLVIREDAAADVAWTPTFREIRDLQIQRNEMLVVPLVFDFQCLRAAGWEAWIDSELVDREFCDRLEQAGVLRSILISRYVLRYQGVTAVGLEMVPIHAHIFLRSPGVNRDIRRYREPLTIANIG